MALRDIDCRQAQPKDKLYRLKDGGSLYLKVTPIGSKIWEFKYKLPRDKTVHTAILGPYGFGDAEIGLVAARKKRDELRVQIRATGQRPVQAKEAAAVERQLEIETKRAEVLRLREETRTRKAQEREQWLAAAQSNFTVEELIRTWLKHKEPTWSERMQDQVTAQLAKFVTPLIGAMPAGNVGMDDIVTVIDASLAEGKVETSRRLRQRMKEMFDYAQSREKITRNPVTMANRDLQDRFKRARLLHPEEAHATVPVEGLPQLVRAMGTYTGRITTRSFMWFIALQACRTGEARLMTWDEIDWDKKIVNLSPQRMKARKGYTMYLSEPALAILKELKQENGHRPFVFAHPTKFDQPCSEMAALKALDIIGYKGRMTSHGFRHLMSTLANEHGVVRKDVIEAALAHGDEDKIRGTYNGATYSVERRKLADWWAGTLQEYIKPNVVAFRAKA